MGNFIPFEERWSSTKPSVVIFRSLESTPKAATQRWMQLNFLWIVYIELEAMDSSLVVNEPSNADSFFLLN